MSLKGIYMVVMLLFCSTKMAAISLGDCDFGVYFQRNSTDQATRWWKMNLLHEHYIHEYYVSKLKGMLTLLGFVFCFGEPKGSVTD